MRDRVYGRLSEIRDNPFIGETLSHYLAGMMSTYVGKWVIIYTVEGNVIILLNLDHHDRAYLKPL